MGQKTFILRAVSAFLFIFVLILTGCSSSNELSDAIDESNKSTHFFDYINADFVIQVPNEWETITAFTSEYPDTVRVAFRNNIQELDFIANIIVSKEELPATMSNFDFSQKTLAVHESTLVDYRLDSQENLDIAVSGGTSASMLNSFHGKKNLETKDLNFKQIYVVKGNDAWTVTAIYSPSEDEFTVEKMETVLKTFKLK